MPEKRNANAPVSGSEPPRKRVGVDTVRRLQRGILRLAFSFRGHHEELDRRLKKLGSMIRAGHDGAELQDLIDGIVETIVAGGLAKAAARIAAKEPDREHALGLLLSKLIVPEEFGADIERLRVRSTQQRERAALLECAEEAAALLSVMLARKAGGEMAALVVTMRRQLMSVVEQIPFSADLLHEVSRVKESVETAATIEQLQVCVASVAGLVADMKSLLQKEIDDLAKFLKGIMQRLQKVEMSIQQSTSSHDESIESASQLSETVQRTMSGIRDEIGSQSELDSLKATINTHLDIIDQDLSRFVQEERRRHSRALHRVDSTVRKLRNLENETAQLRNDLEQQHARVMIDPLTGTFNRAGYNKHIGKEFARWQRYGGALSLAVVDLDDFKCINDNYGHAAGDNVLSTVASQLGRDIRQCDILCRYGGEEFALILPETDLASGLLIVNKLRHKIKTCNFHYKAQPVPVTLSCGVSQFRRGDTQETCFERADQAMYLAKRMGRDRCCAENESDVADA